VREWNEEFKRAKGLLKGISDLGEQIVRGYAASRRQATRGTGAEGTVQA
jgi:hypothetical protein